MGINSGYVAIASYDEILIWHYHTPKVSRGSNQFDQRLLQYIVFIRFQSSSNLHGVKARKEKRFHIDDTPTGVELAKDLLQGQQRRVNDPICALALSEKLLLVARESGVINEYSVANVALRNRHTLHSKVHKIAINCNST